MSEPGTAYRVLARKYRPSRFAELIGQEAMVRTLTNAIATGRIAHAFMLTGVRGVGKTTTARIIARALNCIGPDGKGGPTVEPCGVCEPCRAIAEDRHVDVMEMDAASRTGVDDIRELIDGVRYRPVAARYKVYIIDEVHMLSKKAFNALLKTLEEPPPDVKFIFATTEIHKVPVTVLSRCQRFDLRRVAAEVLAEHYAADRRRRGRRGRARRHGADRPRRRRLGARRAVAARPGDRARRRRGQPRRRCATCSASPTAAWSSTCSRRRCRATPADALRRMAALYDGGADPVMVLQDLLELTHFLTRLKLAPSAGEGDPALEGERARGLALAAKLGIPALTRAWQMLLKGIGRGAGRALADRGRRDGAGAARLCRRSAVAGRAGAQRSRAARAPAPRRRRLPSARAAFRAPRWRRAVLEHAAGSASVSPRGAPRRPRRREPRRAARAAELPRGGRAVRRRSARRCCARISIANVHLVHFEPGRIELRPTEAAPRDLGNRLGQLLSRMDRAALGGQRLGRARRSRRLREQAEARERASESEAARASPGARGARGLSRRAHRGGARAGRRAAAPSPSPRDGGDEHSEGDESDEESRPDDEAGAADAGPHGRDAGAARRASR